MAQIQPLSLASSRHVKRRIRLKKLRPLFWLLAALILAGLFLLSSLWVRIVPVYGSGMSPTLNPGSLTMVVKAPAYSRGDVIAFPSGGTTLIRRVIGLPGDTVSIDDKGQVAVNGVLLAEPYVNGLSLGQCDISFPFQVPENAYFVLGDDRDEALDSRSSVIGCIGDEEILGRVLIPDTNR